MPPLTNAQRQARYRATRQMQGHFQCKGTAMERLDVWVSSDSAHGLRVLAALQHSTAQAVLDRLVLAAVAEVKNQDRAAWGQASIGVLDSASDVALHRLRVRNE